MNNLISIAELQEELLYGNFLAACEFGLDKYSENQLLTRLEKLQKAERDIADIEL